MRKLSAARESVQADLLLAMMRFIVSGMVSHHGHVPTLILLTTRPCRGDFLVKGICASISALPNICSAKTPNTITFARTFLERQCQVIPFTMEHVITIFYLLRDIRIKQFMSWSIRTDVRMKCGTHQSLVGRTATGAGMTLIRSHNSTFLTVCTDNSTVTEGIACADRTPQTNLSLPKRVGSRTIRNGVATQCM